MIIPFKIEDLPHQRRKIISGRTPSGVSAKRSRLVLADRTDHGIAAGPAKITTGAGRPGKIDGVDHLERLRQTLISVLRSGQAPAHGEDRLFGRVKVDRATRGDDVGPDLLKINAEIDRAGSGAGQDRAVGSDPVQRQGRGHDRSLQD
jgi:hypothetical protein